MRRRAALTAGLSGLTFALMILGPVRPAQGSGAADVRPIVAQREDRANGHQIVAVDPRDGSISEVTSPLRRSYEPALSPDATSVAFVHFDASISSPPTLNIVPIWGGAETVIYRSPVGDVGSPTWSPDGSRLAFSCQQPPGEQLCVVERDGSGARILTAFEGRQVREPTWSPDGRWIAFSATADAEHHVFHLSRIHPDGTGLRRITWGHVSTVQPDWSPDGSLIAFSIEGQVWTVRPDGSDRTVLTRRWDPGDRFFDGWPAWSSDGHRIAWVSGKPPCDACHTFNIFTMRPNGHGVRTVTRSSADATIDIDW